MCNLFVNSIIHIFSIGLVTEDTTDIIFTCSYFNSDDDDVLYGIPQMQISPKV